MFSRRRPAVPEWLTLQIDSALGTVDVAQAELTRVVESGAPLQVRRAAHADLRHAFDDADALLRRATAMARQRSYLEWSQWRRRLSRVDTARQHHLLSEGDESGALALGSVRAVDTGMSGPEIGELQHGQSRAPGARPAYGLDLEALLMAPPPGGRPAAAAACPPRRTVASPAYLQRGAA